MGYCGVIHLIDPVMINDTIGARTPKLNGIPIPCVGCTGQDRTADPAKFTILHTYVVYSDASGDPVCSGILKTDILNRHIMDIFSDGHKVLIKSHFDVGGQQGFLCPDTDTGYDLLDRDKNQSSSSVH